MKKKRIAFLLGFAAIMSCNTGEKKEKDDSIEQADSANEQLHDTAMTPTTQVVDEKSTDFLVRAANSAMTELEMTRLAAQQASMQHVKDFATALGNDHRSLNEEIKSLASKKNVTLPATVSKESQEDIDDLAEKVDKKNYDKSFVKETIDRQKECIRLYEETAKEATDVDIKTFANNSLVKLRLRLDSARALEKRHW